MNDTPFRALALQRFIVCMCQPFRAFVSLWLIVCMLFSLTPLGCVSAVGVRHETGGAGQTHIPEVTAEQFKDCGELVQEGLPPGSIPIAARVKLDRNGHVLEATTTGEPNPEVGICLRLALREMNVDTDVIDRAIDRAKLRATSSSAPKVSTIPNRVHIGQVEVITEVVVTVVFVEVVIIDLPLVVLAITVTAVVEMAVDAAQAPSAPARKPHQPVREKWENKGGMVQDNPDGSTTYTRSDGVAVTYDKEGYPDFTPYRHPTVKDVQIEFTGKYDIDRKRANAASNLTETPIGWRWHHHQDGKTMQLIRSDVHEDFFHTGGMAGTRR